MRKYHSILIPIDGSENTLPAVQQRLEIAKLSNARVTALCVMDIANNVDRPAPTANDEGAAAYKECQQAVAQVEEMGKAIEVEVRPLVIGGDPAKEIIVSSQEHDLVVMGTNGRTGLAYLRLGSVAEKAIRQAKCPVLVVRSE